MKQSSIHGYGVDMSTTGRMTEQAYWDAQYANTIRLRLPVPATVSVRDQQRLLARYVRPGDRVLEIGCAPGKTLAWVGKRLGARVAGLDYSEAGVGQARRLFAALQLEADLRCEDVFGTSFPRGSFDLTYSLGVIEHFDDPSAIVRLHVELLAPGGISVIAVPNYRGVYGRMQRYFDPANLEIHNLQIMDVQALRATAPADLASGIRVYPFGRFSPWLVNWQRRWPRALSLSAQLAGNCLGLAQPTTVRALAPWLVLEIRRSADEA